MKEYQELSLEEKKQIIQNNSVKKITQIRWVSKNRVYYEDKGYSFTRYNDIIPLRVEDIKPNTSSKFACNCNKCKKDIEVLSKTFWSNVLRDRHYGLFYCFECEMQVIRDAGVNYASVKGENNPMYGKHHSKETKEKIRKHHLENREFFSNLHKGKAKSPEHKRKLSLIDRKGNKNGSFGRKKTKEEITKISNSVKKWRYITFVNNKRADWFIPGYNINILPLFKYIREKLDSSECYFAENPYEYRLLYDELSTKAYYLDFISIDKKLIIEYNERTHKYYDKEKEMQRKNTIMQYFPEFKWISIEEGEFNSFEETFEYIKKDMKNNEQ